MIKHLSILNWFFAKSFPKMKTVLESVQVFKLSLALCFTAKAKIAGSVDAL